VESNHARPPYQSGACPAGPSSSYLVGRIRTSVPHRRRVVLDPLSYDESALSTGVEPAPPGRQPGRATRRVRERVLPSAGDAFRDPLRNEWSPGESNPARVDASHHPGHLEPHVRATAGTRTRSAALATPCASDLTPRSHRERPERGSNPRHRCERPGSWPTRRPGRAARTEGIEPSPAALETAWTPCPRPSDRAPRAGFEPRILRFRAEDPAA
jgi:hypothetical protein